MAQTGDDTVGVAARPPARRGRPTNAERAAIADRRDLILAAATRRFAEDGFRATTVRQIADDVQILSGSLYYHFATKEDILAEVVRETVERMRDVAVAIAARDVGAEARLTALVDADLAELQSRVAVHAILYNERKFFRLREDFAFVVRAKKEAFAAWERIIRDGIAEGVFRADLDMFLTITTIVRQLNAAADWFASGDAGGDASVGARGVYDVASVSAFHRSFILHAIRCPERIGAPVPDPATEF